MRRTALIKFNILALALLHAGAVAAHTPSRQGRTPHAASPAQASARDDGGPVTKAWLLYELRPSGPEIGEIVRQVEQRGAAFRPSDEDEKELLAAGATDALVKAVHASYRGPLDMKELSGMLRRARPARTSAAETIKQVEKRGVGFQLSPGDEAALRREGASAEVIAAVRANYRNEEHAAASKPSREPNVLADPFLFRPDPRQIPPGNGTGGGGGVGVGSGTGGGVGISRSSIPNPCACVDTGGARRGSSPGAGDEGVDYTRVFCWEEVPHKAIITFKPQPGYTEDARRNGVTGFVGIYAVLRASGDVSDIRVFKPLPYGLTEKAIAAAKQIRFTPAEKDGRKVSQCVTLEFTFNQP